ncbi:hypothetical protein DITRI_Ditri02bG0197300 [Diplodiscus trichospermus]
MKPHVAIVPSFGLGHLIPLFEFAKNLVVRHGIRVSLLVVTTNEPSAAEDQLLSSPIPPDLHIVKLPPVDVGKANHHMSRLPLASGIFLNSWEDVEPVSINALKENPFFKQIPAPPVYPIGPLIKQEETLSRTDVECLEWLDNQPSDSVIFVTFGSGGTLSVEQQTELAWGLELSQQRFIWVLRKPTDAACAGTFFNTGSEVNESKAYLPEGFLNKTQGVGLVVPSWAPQVSILGHPSTSGFLSHFG